VLVALFAFAMAGDPAVEADLQNVVDDVVEAYESSDWTSLMAIYKTNAVLLVPGAPLVVGNQAITQFYEQTSGVSNMVLTIVDGDYLHLDNTTGYAEAYGWGNSTVMMNGMTFTGDFLTIFERANSSASWVIKIDSFINNNSTMSVGSARTPRMRRFRASDSTLVTELKADSAKWEKAWKAGNATKMADFYTSDAVLLLNGMMPVEGSDEIIQMFTGAFTAIGSVKVHLADAGYSAKDSYAYARGNETLWATNGTVWDMGNYLSVLRREGGDWKTHAVLYTSSMHS